MSIARLVGRPVELTIKDRRARGVIVGQMTGRKLVVRVLGSGMLEHTIIDDVQIQELDPELTGEANPGAV